MRISFISELSLPQSPTLGRELSQLTAELRYQGHRPMLILPAQPNWHVHHPSVQCVPALPLPGEHGLTLTFPQASPVKRQLTASDVIHVFQPFNLGRWATAVAREQKKPLVFSWRTDYYETQTPTGVIRNQGEVPYLRQAQQSSLVIADSESHATELRSKLDVPVLVLRRPAQTVPFQAVRRGVLRSQLGLSASAKICMTDVPHSSTELQFLDGILDRLPPATVLVALGPASAIHRIQHAHKAMKHTQRMHLVAVEHPYLAAGFLMDADVALFLSHHTKEHIALQALAAELPIIAAQGTPAATLVAETGAGVVVKHTYTDVTDKLQHLLLRPAQHRMIADHARSAVSQRSIKRTATQLTNIYQLAKRLAVHP